MSNETEMIKANPNRSSFLSELRIRLNTVIWFVLGLGFLLSLPIIFDWAGWVFLVILVIAAVLAIPTAWLRRAVFDRGRQRPFVRHWIGSSVALLFVLCILVAVPIYYLATITETRPAVYPQATLTNGQKTVVFQGMQHFGSENFYKSVIYDLEKALADGYVIYYEAVQTSTPESKAFFEKLSDALTGSSDLAGTYKAMGQACGLKFQSDYFTLLDADKQEHPERHVIADVDAIELKQEYERLLRTDPEFAKAHADDFKESPGGDASASMASMIEWLESGSEGQKKLAGIVCRGIMTLAFAPKENEEPGQFDPLIIDFRNRALAKRIIEDPHDKIFITYGARHLPGVLELLKQQDPNWKVATVKWMRTIEAPKRSLEGKLTVHDSD
jgi:hypothetical protein